MLCKGHLCTFFEEIFLINMYGSDSQKDELSCFLKNGNGDSLKRIIRIAALLKKRVEK